MLSKQYVNVPFSDVVPQMPSYAKFLKDILTKKRTIDDIETVAMTAQGSVLIQHHPPRKCSDPGSFTIPLNIRDKKIGGALCDLGASVSLLPLSITQNMNLGDIKPTRMTIQLADRSLVYPMGVLEDVPVKVGNFYIPVDFVVMNMTEDEKTPIILGRPFLATAGAMIDCANGTLTLHLGEDTVEFNVQKAQRNEFGAGQCYMVDVVPDPIDVLVKTSQLMETHEDELLGCLVNGLIDGDETALQQVAKFLAEETVPATEE